MSAVDNKAIFSIIRFFNLAIVFFIFLFFLGCSNKECQKEVLVFIDECDNLTSINLNFNQVNIYKESKELTGCMGSGKLVYHYCIEIDTLTIRANINGKDTTLHYNKNEIPQKILFGYIDDIQIFTEKDEGRWMLD